jgi:pyridoxal phosphate enzyme (YggS family)
MEPKATRRKLSENLRKVEDRIAGACARAGRRREDVTLVAVTKYASLDIIRTLVDLDVQDIGESRVQELTKRAAMVDEWLSRRARDLAAGARPRPRWHMIGHLQRNKVKAVLPWAHMIHSVDSLRLAEEINNQAGKLDRVIPVMIEVNAAGEASKNGIAVAAATHFVEQVQSLKHLEITGLMAMAPFTDDESVIRATFTRVRELYDEIIGERLAGTGFRMLSLGMSNDFEYGIEAGATHVRIGTALLEGIDLAPQTVPADGSTT